MRTKRGLVAAGFGLTASFGVLATPAFGAPIRSRADTWAGSDVQTIEWTDRSGNPRSVSILADNIRIIRQSYLVDGEEVTDEAVGDYGIGNMVHHGGCGAVASWESTSDYTAEAVVEGPNHYVWQSTFLLPMCDFPDVHWRVTNEYVFTTGEDSFIQTIAYDSSDLDPSTDLFDDMRGPYNQMDWPKDGVITGFGWGSEYRFITTGPIADGDANVGGSVVVPWDWTEPNTIPYVLEWASPNEGGAVDREVGIVQNQPYVEQDFGGGYYGCGTDCWATPPPLSGEAMPASWAVPTQLSAYDSNYRSGRITWGGVYGAFQNGHANDTGSIPNMGDRFRPVNAWSFSHVIGRHSDAVVFERVTDTENLYASTLTASTGSVRTSGPRGPGNFVGPDVGNMPDVPYSNPGLDFVYRTWNVEADGGVATLTLDVSGTLGAATFVVHEFPNGEPAIALDGSTLTPDADVFLSYDASTGRLFVTLAEALDAGEHSLTVSADGEVPAPSEPEPANPEPEPTSDDEEPSTDPGVGGTVGGGDDAASGGAAELLPSGDERPEPASDEPPSIDPSEPSENGPSGTTTPRTPRDDAGSRSEEAASAGDDAGCGCRVAKGRAGPASLLLLLLGAALLRRYDRIIRERARVAR